MTETIEFVECKRLRPSPFQPREDYEKAYIDSLAASIKVHGILQPLLVRPLKGGEDFELIAGHCRHKAAGQAQLHKVPCLVKALSDEQVLLVIAVEVDQKKDLEPWERGIHYKKLLETGKLKLKDIAKEIGKSEASVRGLVSLADLPPKARESLRCGKLSTSVAVLIATRPSKAIRDKLTEFALGEVERWTDGNKIVDLPTHAECSEYIKRKLCVELKQAPFPQGKKELVAGVPSCKDCPKRSGNDRENYPTARADVCTDPECYQNKVKAWGQLQLSEAVKKGHPVLSEAQSRHLFGNAGFMHLGGGYVELDGTYYYDKAPKQRTFREILGKAVKAEHIVIAVDEWGRTRELLVEKEAKKMVEDKLGVPPIANGTRHNPQAEEKAREEQKQKKLKVIMAAGDAVGRIRMRMGLEGKDYLAELLDIIMGFVTGAVSHQSAVEWCKHGEPEGKTFDVKLQIMVDRFNAANVADRVEMLVDLLALQCGFADQDGHKEVKQWFSEGNAKKRAVLEGNPPQATKLDTKTP